MAEKPPSAPKGTRRGGRELWDDVLARFVLERHETVLLTEAVRTKDNIDALEAKVAIDGVTIEGRVHPCVVELRQQRLVLARLLAALRLPDEDDQAGRRPQRRRIRGVYNLGVGGVS